MSPEGDQESLKSLQERAKRAPRAPKRAPREAQDPQKPSILKPVLAREREARFNEESFEELGKT